MFSFDSQVTGVLLVPSPTFLLPFPSLTTSTDLHRGERWPNFHLVAHQPNFHVSYDYCAFYSPGAGCPDGECAERQWVAPKKDPGTHDDRVTTMSMYTLPPHPHPH